MPLRKKIYNLICVTPKGNKLSFYINIFISILIVINVIAVILESVESIYSMYQSVFIFIEIVSIGIFSVEYLLRIWSCVEDKNFKNPIVGRIKFSFTPLALIDLLAILPFYILLVPGISSFMDLRILRALRLFRLIRILKLARYTDALDVIKRVLVAKKEKLIIVLSFTAVLLIFCSSLMYYIEKDNNPAFSSIPKTLWWGVASITPLPHGDLTPNSPEGMFLTVFLALLGIGWFALPAGILASGFIEEMASKEKRS